MRYLIRGSESRDILGGVHGPRGAHVAVRAAHVGELLVDARGGPRPPPVRDLARVDVGGLVGPPPELVGGRGQGAKGVGLREKVSQIH